MEKREDITAYTLSEKANTLLNTSALFALCAAATTMAEPVTLLAAAALLPVYNHHVFCKKIKEKYEDPTAFYELTDYYANQATADATLQKKNLTEKMGAHSKQLNIPEPIIHILPSADAPEPTFLPGLSKTANQTNASLPALFKNQVVAFPSHKNLVVISSEVAKSLEEKELSAIVAHELGHIAYDHKNKQNELSDVSATASNLAYLNFLTTLGAGPAAGLILAKNLIAGAALYAFGSNKSSPLLNMAAVVCMPLIELGAVAYIGTPEAIKTFVGVKAIDLASEYITSRQSRQDEYQADHAAALLTDGFSFSKGLKKIEDLIIGTHPTSITPAENKKSVFNKLWSAAKAGIYLWHSHPPTERRQERVLKIAQQTASPAP